MPTPRGGGIFKSSSSSTKAKPMARASEHENDLLPEPCTSPQHETYQESLSLCKQHMISPSSGASCGGNSNDDSSGQQDMSQPDAALMDFWVLLQQTQSNLQVGQQAS